MELAMREIILFAIMFVVVLAIIGAMIGYSKFLDWQEGRRTTVKSSRISPRIVMSRSAGNTPEIAPSSLQTDASQTAARPMMPAPTREQILDIFRVLRVAGIKREVIQGPWRAAGLKFDNNLWAQAAPPPEEPTAITPIAGRPTNAQFPDHELSYQPPPSRSWS